MDASPGSQFRKGMGFRSWDCGSGGTCRNRPPVYFSGELFSLSRSSSPPPPLLFHLQNMGHTSRQCRCLFLLRFARLGIVHVESRRSLLFSSIRRTFKEMYQGGKKPPPTSLVGIIYFAVERAIPSVTVPSNFFFFSFSFLSLFFITERNFGIITTETASSQIEPPEGRISPPSPFTPLVSITFILPTNSMEYHQHPPALFSPLFLITHPSFTG